MNRLINCLIAAILVLSIVSGIYIVSYFASVSAEAYCEYDGHDITSEGPDCRTARWYLSGLIIGIDDVLDRVCMVVENDWLLIAWRTWLKEQYNITMY